MEETNQPAPEVQDPSVFTGPEKSHSHKKLAIIVGVLLLLVVAAVIVTFALNRKDSETTPTNKTAASANKYLVSDDDFLCTSGGVRAILCENVATGTQTKYEVPSSLGIIWTAKISPDGNKILLATQGEDSTTPNRYYIVNRKMEILNTIDRPGDSVVPSTFTWLKDGSGLVYDYSTAGKTDSKLYLYNIPTHSNWLLTKGSQNIAYPVTLKDGTIIASDNSKQYFTYYAVDVKTGNLTPVDTTSMYKSLNNYEVPQYNASTDKFYLVYTPKANGNATRVGEIEHSGNSYAMRAVENITMPRLATPGAITSKGTPVDEPHDANAIHLFNGADKTTVSLPNSPVLLFASGRLPFDNPAKDAKLTAADSLYETSTPPARLQQFLLAYVTKDCAPGEYRNVQLAGYEGDSQAMILEGDCGEPSTNRASIFIYTEGSYKNIASSQEGFECAVRDKFQLSTKVLPNCVKPGEGH